MFVYILQVSALEGCPFSGVPLYYISIQQNIHMSVRGRIIIHTIGVFQGINNSPY